MTATTWKEPLSPHDSVVDLLESRAEEQGEEVFVRFPERVLTYRELADRSESLATGLADAGAEPGERICIIMNNCPEFVEVFFAVLRTGATVVPLNVSLRGDDLEYALDDADPAVIVLDRDCLDAYAAVHDRLSIPYEVVVDDENTNSEERVDEGEWTELSAFKRPISEAPSFPSLSQTDSASIIYTSGTTGLPKGVILPHGAYLTVGTELAERVIQPAADDTFYMSQPLFHIFAQQVMMEALVAGVPLAMERWFSASNFWDRVDRYDATIIHFSSAISDILYRNTNTESNSVRIAYGAIDDDIQAPFEEKFSCQVIPLYGLTETGGIALSGTISDPQQGSMGVPTRYADVAVVDQADKPLPTGEEGEIIVRPTRPNAMFHGYFDKPDRTAETTTNLWLHTGDIGRRDENGQFHFVNRQAHFLRRKGENVSVNEVERILQDHPGVDEAVVVGVDANVGGEEVLAAIKPAAGTDLKPLELIEHCDGRLAYFKIPRYIRIVDEFPRTETKGTIERYRIRDQGADDAWDREETDYQLER